MREALLLAFGFLPVSVSLSGSWTLLQGVGNKKRFLFFNSCLVFWSVVYQVPFVFFFFLIFSIPPFSSLLFILLLLVRLRHVQA